MTNIQVSYSKSQSQLVSDAVHDFYTGFNEASSFENLAESSGLISSLIALKRTVDNKATQEAIERQILTRNQTLSRFRKASQKRLLRRFATLTSGSYLFYSFAIAPLISDMSAVKKSLRVFNKLVDARQRSAGKVVSTHKRQSGTIRYLAAPPGGEGSSYQDGCLSYLLQGRKATRTVTVRGTMGQKYEFSLFKRLAFMIDRFGATGPLDLAWEFVPYSFISDWFLDVRNITDRIDNAITGDTKKIIDVCLSEKTECTSVQALASLYPYDIGQAGTVLCQSSLSQYHRNPVLDYNIVGQAGRFGKKQASLLAALLHQKMANRR